MITTFIITMCEILAMSVIIDWITQLITKTSLGFLSSMTVACAVHFMWVIIATGGIIR